MGLGKRVELGVFAHALTNIVLGAVAVVVGIVGGLGHVVPLVQGDAKILELPHPEGVVVASSSAAVPIDLGSTRSSHAAVAGVVRRPSGTDARFDRLALCESSGDPRAVNGEYRGAFQFLITTWQEAGGTGDPVDAGYEQQRVVAQAWARASDPAKEWPVCWTRTA